MYCNPKLKRLLKQAGEIISIFQNTKDAPQCPTFQLHPFMEPGEKDSEVVTIVFQNIGELEWNFLEPLSKYCIDRNVSWTIRVEDEGHDLCIDIR